MPINESLARPSNLTTEQQREAMRSIYGLQERKEEVSPENLTYDERIKLRRLLDSLDQKEAGGMKVFDLNKPPREPYVYREYPFLMYHPEAGTKAARNWEERQQLKTEGWSEDPACPAPEPQIELTEQERSEAESIDKQLIKKRRS